MKRLLLSLCLACAILPRELPAQQQREQLERARTYSWWVRASRGDSIVAIGRVRALTSDAVRIDTMRIPVTDITMLERRTKIGGGWRRGAITGSIILGALGVLVYAELCGYSESSNQCHPLEYVGTAALGVAIGFPIGGMIGEIARPGKHEWQTIWPTAGN